MAVHVPAPRKSVLFRSFGVCSQQDSLPFALQIVDECVGRFAGPWRDSHILSVLERLLLTPCPELELVLCLRRFAPGKTKWADESVFFGALLRSFGGVLPGQTSALADVLSANKTIAEALKEGYDCFEDLLDNVATFAIVEGNSTALRAAKHAGLDMLKFCDSWFYFTYMDPRLMAERDDQHDEAAKLDKDLTWLMSQDCTKYAVDPISHFVFGHLIDVETENEDDRIPGYASMLLVIARAPNFSPPSALKQTWREDVHRLCDDERCTTLIDSSSLLQTHEKEELKRLARLV